MSEQRRERPPILILGNPQQDTGPLIFFSFLCVQTGAGPSLAPTGARTARRSGDYWFLGKCSSNFHGHYTPKGVRWINYGLWIGIL